MRTGAHARANSRVRREWVRELAGFSFEPCQGAPGRAYAVGQDWIEDVLALSDVSFPRRAWATSQGMRAVVCVRVPDGVAEFFMRVPRAEDAALIADLVTYFHFEPEQRADGDDED